MNWEVALVPLIGLAVLIVATIISGLRGQQELERPARSPDEGGRMPVPPRRRHASELDQFLEEARQRRDPPRRRAEPQAEPRREPSAERPPVRKKARERRPVEPPRPEPAPAVVMAPPPAPEPPAPAFVPPEPAPPPPPPAPPAVKPPSRRGSPVLTGLAAALRDRNALATAFILGEVLGRPRSERR